MALAHNHSLNSVMALASCGLPCVKKSSMPCGQRSSEVSRWMFLYSFHKYTFFHYLVNISQHSSYPEGNLGVNRLLDGLISLKPQLQIKDKHQIDTCQNNYIWKRKWISKNKFPPVERTSQRRKIQSLCNAIMALAHNHSLNNVMALASCGLSLSEEI